MITVANLVHLLKKSGRDDVEALKDRAPVSIEREEKVP